jgi:hypothetical protein
MERDKGVRHAPIKKNCPKSGAVLYFKIYFY